MRSLPYVLVIGLALAGPAAAWAASPADTPGAVPAAAPAATPAAAVPADTPPAESAEKRLQTQAADLVKEVEAIRDGSLGMGFSVRVVSPDEGRSRIEAELESRYAGSEADQVDRSVRLLGLMTPACSTRRTYLDLLGGEVLALYLWDARVLALVPHEGDNPPPLTRRLGIVHELAKAFDQWNVYGGSPMNTLEYRAGRSHDGRITLLSVLEGSAALFEKRYLAKAQQDGKVGRAAVLQFAEYEQVRAKRFLEQPAYFHVFIGAQVCGRRFLLRGQAASVIAEGKATGEEEVRIVSRYIPDSTEQILHPEKYYDPETRDLPVSVLDATVERAFGSAGGWRVALRDTLGEMLCALATRPKDAKVASAALSDPAYYTNEAAAGWGGDRFYLLVRPRADRPAAPDAQPAPADDPYECRGVWITVWDTPKDRGEFVAAFEAATPAQGRAVERFGQRTAVFFLGFPEADREDLLGRLKWMPPVLTRGGRPVDL